MNTTEIWKDIEEYEGLYKISNLGRVKSCKLIHKGKEKILRQSLTYKGYLQVCLSKNNKQKTFRVHRLVAKAFIPNISNKPQINHIDSNKQNNEISNLEWVDNGENQKHAFKYGNQIRYKGSKNCSSIKIVQYDKDDNLIQEWGSIAEASQSNKISKTSICNCLRKRSNSAGGYMWKYKEGGRYDNKRNNRRYFNRLHIKET